MLAGQAVVLGRAVVQLREGEGEAHGIEAQKLHALHNALQLHGQPRGCCPVQALWLQCR